MRLPHLKKKFIAGALAAGLVMGAGGIAAAYFTAGGTGTGSASAGTAVRFSVSTPTPATGLLPGSPKTLTFKVTNTQTYKEAFSGAKANVTQSSATCDITASTPSPTSDTLAGHASTTVTVTVTMTTNPTYNQNGCYATVTLTL